MAAGSAAEAATAAHCEAGAAPVAARFEVRITPPKGVAQPARQQTWTFIREAQQVALIKGDVEERWRRDESGRIRFERIFHADRHVVDYSPGELATLNVQPAWAALSCFVDPQNLVATARRQPTAGAWERVTWNRALNLPSRLERRSRDGTLTRLRLTAQFAVPPAGWPLPGERSDEYLHLDAADFGDMDYDPVVRKSEALDLRAGWRAPHSHD
jgi:hypothetical protein